jgi:hypothetical protein
LAPGKPASIWEKITQIDESKGHWAGGMRLGPQVLSRLIQSALITSTSASTRIEGARPSDEDVEKLMRGSPILRMVVRANPSGLEGCAWLLQILVVGEAATLR